MQQMVLDVLGRWGEWGVFFLIAVENLFPPIPSEVILTFAGFLTGCTQMTAPGVIAAATGGSTACLRFHPKARADASFYQPP